MSQGVPYSEVPLDIHVRGKGEERERREGKEVAGSLGSVGKRNGSIDSSHTQVHTHLPSD